MPTTEVLIPKTFAEKMFATAEQFRHQDED